MCKAYLSFTELKEYLQELQQLELIDYNEETRVFNLTDKGAKYVDVFDRMKGLVNEKAAARRRINDELGLCLDDRGTTCSNTCSSISLRQICKLYLDVKDEDYNYGFAGGIVSNSWRKNAFVTVYECKLDHDKIKMITNPYEISNVYFLSIDKVVEFYNSSPSLFVPGFVFTLKAYLNYYYSKK
jgi:isopentenyldiphosphate isomerase